MLNKLWVFDIFVFVNAMISNICMIKFNMTWKLGFPSNEFSASKLLYWKQSKWDQQKFLLVFSLKLFVFLRKSTVSKEVDVWCLNGFERIWCLNSYNFESYPTTFHNKDYHNGLLNFTDLSVVYKCTMVLRGHVAQLINIFLR